MPACPFCVRYEELEVGASNEDCVSFLDAFPLSPGHTLVVPKRHEPNFFSLTAQEHTSLWQLVDEVRSALIETHAPDGWNIGINVGNAGGQTIDHAHVHVIPRYFGDQPDPRGGVRRIFPERAAYWDA